MRTKRLIVNTNSDTYPIIIGSNVLTNLSKILRENSLNGNKFLFVIDKNVPKNLFQKSIVH